MCEDKNIKELIPAYLDQALDIHEHEMVTKHLESCGDCRADLALLHLMHVESVPDPGEKFWDEMPSRVFRAVVAQKARKWSFELSWLTDRLILPRWVLAASTVGLALVISWLAVQTPQRRPAVAVSQGYEPTQEIMVSDAVPLSDLNHDQLDTIATWARSELVSIAHEAAPVMANTADTDLYEEIIELNAKEAERLSNMLDQWEQEG
jgi:anti-sigma factor RsiW